MLRPCRTPLRMRAWSLLDLHAPAAAKALLAPPEFVVDIGLGNRNAGGQT